MTEKQALIGLLYAVIDTEYVVSHAMCAYVDNGCFVAAIYTDACGWRRVAFDSEDFFVRAYFCHAAAVAQLPTSSHWRDRFDLRSALWVKRDSS